MRGSLKGHTETHRLCLDLSIYCVLFKQIASRSALFNAKPQYASLHV